jgi:hypothetical protein
MKVTLNGSRSVYAVSMIGWGIAGAVARKAAKLRWMPGKKRALYDVAMPSSGPDPDTVVTTGTSQRPGARWSGKKPLEIEREVQRRNLGAYEKVIVPLYQKTAPVRKEYQFEGVSEAEAEASGLFSAPIDNEATVDLDQMFPWWRTPWALVDAEGNYSYPNMMPSGQHVTAMIRSLFSIEDPDFMERITPLIERSIAAAPDQPSTPEARKLSTRSAERFLRAVITVEGFLRRQQGATAFNTHVLCLPYWVMHAFEARIKPESC